MPIKLPNLDDRSYADLVDEAVSSIPDVYPGWTDHNPSNPGIALIELFAWLTEMVLYRTGQIPQRNYEVFLKLLNGPSWVLPPGQPLDAAISDTVKVLRDRYRAVSPEDYEILATQVFPGTSAAFAGVTAAVNRVRCLAERNLEGANKTAPAPGHMSLLVVPDLSAAAPPWPAPSSALVAALKAFFKDRKLLTTRLHVTGPSYVPVGVSATLYLLGDADYPQVFADARAALFDHFHPCQDGALRRGFPFGRDLYVSEVYALLDQVRGVDYVEGVKLQRLDAAAPPSTDPIPLLPHELVQVDNATMNLQMMELRGDKWQPITL